MKIYGWRGEIPNFGDELNFWMWPKLFGDSLDRLGEGVFVGIGSILDERFESFQGRRLVFGAGMRQEKPLRKADEWDIRFVRGPLTKAAIGLDCQAITDPAILIASERMAAHWVRPSDRKGIGFVPYFRTDPKIYRRIAEALGAKVIEVSLPPDVFLREIASCEGVVAEAMHGAIAADSLRVKWKAIGLTSHWYEGATSDFKWSDWLQSMGLTMKVSRCMPAELGKFVRRSRLSKTAAAQTLISAWAVSELRKMDWTMSPDAIFAERLAAVEKQVDELVAMAS